MTDFSNISSFAPTTVEQGVKWVDFGATRVRITFPESGDMRAHIDSIISGKEYPALQLPGYVAKNIIDIGANVGATALYFAFSFPQANVFAFEPSAQNFSHLKNNAQASTRIQAFPYGLLDRADRVELYSGKLQSMQCSIVPGPETSDRSETIELRSADDEMKRLGIDEISILKLDTEGCELPILTSLSSWLPRTDFIYIEYHSEADRRAIDRLTEDLFILTTSRATAPHRGQILYTNKRIADRYEIFNRQRIVQPKSEQRH
jgi:FkbM family methyltransferase